YQHMILTQRGNTPIRLDAFGQAIEGVENSLVAGWANTNRAVLVIIQKQADANVIETVDRIKAALPQLERWMPAGIKLSILSDRTQTIRASVNDVEGSLLISIALVVMVVFLFLRRFWPTFIANITVPLALSGTMGLMYLLHYSLDNLSLMAITISVGFVVDDAIVVIENIHRHLEQGERPLAAALAGARQIGFTVISMSLSLTAVFIPLLFMGGLVGRLFHEFAVTVSLAILVSGVLSLTLTPMLCSRFLKAEAELPPPGWFSRRCEAAYQWLLSHYELGLHWVLRHQRFTLIVTVLTMGATVWLYTVVPKGFFPQQDTGVLMGTTESSQDISFAAMARLQQRIANIVLADPDVATLGSFIGAGGGGSTMNNGRMFITLKPKSQRDASAEQVIARLRRKTMQVAGINLYLQAVQDIRIGGRLSKAQFQYALTSPDLNALGEWSAKLVAKLKAYPELKDVTSDQQMLGLQMNVVVDRDAAAHLGVSLPAIDNTLYDAFGQRQVSVIYTAYNQHHVILEASPNLLADPAALNKIYVRSTRGQQIPLASVAHFEPANTSLSVNHQSQFPASTLSFNLAPGVALSEATELVQRATEELHMPSTVAGSFQGTAQIFQSSLKGMPLLIAAAILAVYLILGMLYESLIHPLTILSTLPSAGVGALLALFLWGYDLSLVSFIAIILLMGIVKKNAIMMID
ncbi:MAG TPA: efflux RND transporter permease subunit, partial [Verrucomicrobiae bacterium]